MEHEAHIYGPRSSYMEHEAHKWAHIWLTSVPAQNCHCPDTVPSVEEQGEATRRPLTLTPNVGQ